MQCTLVCTAAKRPAKQFVNRKRKHQSEETPQIRQGWLCSTPGRSRAGGWLSTQEAAAVL